MTLFHGDDVFDPSHRFETSWLIGPWPLFLARALIALYAFVVLFFNIIWKAVQPGSYVGPNSSGASFSYFTNLSYWGLAFYFLFAAIHTFSYARHGTPLLNRWPRILQILHSFFHTTVVTFPFLVTIVYWVVLYTGPWFSLEYDAWSNISEHAMNTLFALFEMLIPRTNPRPWLHLPFLIIILALYLALAYVVHAAQGYYVYGFLDPGKGVGKTVGYIFGILAAIVIVFLLVRLIMWGRKWLTETKAGLTGRFHGGRPMGHGDVELETTRAWEK